MDHPVVDLLVTDALVGALAGHLNVVEDLLSAHSLNSPGSSNAGGGTHMECVTGKAVRQEFRSDILVDALAKQPADPWVMGELGHYW